MKTPAAAVLAAFIFSSALPATIWTEIGDAGSLPGTAQRTAGAGPLTEIRGLINHTLDADMFQIFITGGGAFSASTIGGTGLDTQLFLFSAPGFGVYANDDAVSFPYQSQLPAGHPLTPAQPGFYYLVVTPWDLDPTSALGLIFPTFPYEGVFGPTGPGGSLPISGYSGFGDAGPYTVFLTGAEFAVVPEPATLLLVSAGLGWLVTRGRDLRIRR